VQPSRVLLLRPDPGNDRFGLGPFFRVEPLGLEYVAAALESRGARVTVLDLRFERGLRGRAKGAGVVGISCMHALEYDRALETAREARREAPAAFIVVGGHAAAAYPSPLERPEVDAICLDDGERVLPALVAALESGSALYRVPGLRLRTGDGWITTAALTGDNGLDAVPLPERRVVDRYRSGYHCLLFRPVWLVETARGCPFRCSFCSVWKLYGRSFRERSIESVCKDMEAAGEHVFLVDDLFWNHPERSLALAKELLRRGVRKRWILVQTRTDVVCRHPELLEAWRPLARDFDVFFGLEAASDAALDGVVKDATVRQTIEAARIARELRFGVTGNFLVDPDWEEAQFEELWEFVDRHQLHRAGYTILTPLPGTEPYETLRPRLAGKPWHAFDMHHLLVEPRLPAERFFELYAEMQSFIGVAQELNRRGWRRKSWTTKDGKRREGKPWDKESLRHVLVNPLYVGLQKLGHETFRGEHQGIVPAGLFRQVQAILRESKRPGRGGRPNVHGALLRGLLHCASCDRAMAHQWTRSHNRLYRYYVCQRAMKEGWSSCATKSVSALEVEQFIIDRIRGIGRDPELRRATFEEALAQLAAERRGLTAEAKRIERELVTARRDVERLVATLSRANGAAAGTVEVEVEKAQERVATLERRAVEIADRVALLDAQKIDEADLARALESFDPVWNALLTPEKERVLRLLIERVAYDGATKQMQIRFALPGFAALAADLASAESTS
jgi:radical SAM superfamily enzyme YgiQ (UPF0313 family)